MRFDCKTKIYVIRIKINLRLIPIVVSGFVMKGCLLMNNEERIQMALKYMKEFHKNDYSGHDVEHVNRVHALAKYIAKNEGFEQPFIIEISSILHDTIDPKLVNEQQGKNNLIKFLSDIELSKDDQNHVIHIIENMSFKKGSNNFIELSTEGQIVRDADRLDAIGAIGIARTFQFAGYFNEPMWTETKVPDNFSDSTLTQLPPSAIKHFYEKLFKLKDLMHTKTAKHIAIQRHEFMKTFVSQFFDEWHYI